jgi:hypothetical protein
MIENSTVSFNISFLEESAVKLAESHLALENGQSYTPVKPILEESKKVLTNLTGYYQGWLNRIRKSRRLPNG